MCFLEASVAGPAVAERYVDVIDRFIPLVEEIESYETSGSEGWSGRIRSCARPWSGVSR
jgi:hypothetical protein